MSRSSVAVRGFGKLPASGVVGLGLNCSGAGLDHSLKEVLLPRLGRRLRRRSWRILLVRVFRLFGQCGRRGSIGIARWRVANRGGGPARRVQQTGFCRRRGNKHFAGCDFRGLSAGCRGRCPVFFSNRRVKGASRGHTRAGGRGGDKGEGAGGVQTRPCNGHATPHQDRWIAIADYLRFESVLAVRLS